MNVLFVAWDGPHQNYLESLFLPIFHGLKKHGYGMHVMQFRWGSPEVIQSAREASHQLGIRYQHQRIVRRPKVLATALTVIRGADAIRRYVLDHDIDVLMPRSTLPAAMSLLALRRLGKDRPRLLFDADGFTPDERVDFAGWKPTGLMYRLFRDAEAQAVRRAQAVVTRTERARQVLDARAGAGTDAAKIHVIPNGKDESLFAPGDDESRAATRQKLGVNADAPLVVYAGSLGPQYFPAEMLDFFRRICTEDDQAHMVVLTGQEDVARSTLAGADVPADAVTITRVAADEVPEFLSAADVGLGLRAPAWSARGLSPIKVGEYLLCGTPVIATRGVGDLDVQLDKAVGFLLDDVSSQSLDAAADWFLHSLQERDNYRRRCRERGVEVFGLSRCVQRYAAALETATS